jgi:mannose-6-phosphate isomerase-like protein (cupin superfamily)
MADHGARRPVVIDEANIPIEAWAEPGRAPVAWRTLISGDRTPSEGLTLGVSETPFAPEAPFTLHRHAQSEAYYVLSGEGVVSIDGVESALGPGVAVFIPGGALHGARALGVEPLRLLWVFAANAFEDVIYEFPDEAGGSVSPE